MTSAKARYIRHDLHFRFDARTSRGALSSKPSWFLLLEDPHDDSNAGIGECSLIPGLSPEREAEAGAALERLVKGINAMGFDLLNPVLADFQHPAVKMAWETARLDYQHGGRRLLFDTPFVRGEEGIPINGLIWMADRNTMWSRVEEKMKAGFRVIKLKIGALDFDEELRLLKDIRKTYGDATKLEIRVDANGAFAPEKALEKLQRLSECDLHSIEQPIAAGQWEAMQRLCARTPIPIALDEELIGLNHWEQKKQLLETIRPQFIILKPSLIGGLQESSEWADLAEGLDIGWWATSALESNIGLNAIAQWTAHRKVEKPQGLGTGQLFHDNFESPLVIRDQRLWHDPIRPWKLSNILEA